MPRTRPPYPPEFREQLVALHRAGRTIEELAREFEPSEQTIRNWVAQSAPTGGTAGTALTGTSRGPVLTLFREHGVR